MVQNDLKTEYPDVLGNFEGFPNFYYVFSATLPILMNSVLIFIMLSRKVRRDGAKFNNYVLFSLALCDLLYEATTTSLLPRSTDSWEDGAESCKTLTFVYLGFNFCTVLLLVMATIENILLADFGKALDRAIYNVLCCISVWALAFGLTYTQLNSDTALIDEKALAMLGNLKAFGYVLSNAILCFGVLLTVFMANPFFGAFTTAKFGKDSKVNTTRQRRSSFDRNPRPKRQSDVLFSCMFMALFVVWCAWILLGVDSSIMKSIEVMKSFEAVRLAARTFNLLALHSLLQRNDLTAL